MEEGDVHTYCVQVGGVAVGGGSGGSGEVAAHAVALAGAARVAFVGWVVVSAAACVATLLAA